MNSTNRNVLIFLVASCVPVVAQVLFLKLYFDSPPINGQRDDISESTFLLVQIAIAAIWLAIVLLGAERFFWKGLIAILSAPIVLGPPLFWGGMHISCRFNLGCF